MCRALLQRPDSSFARRLAFFWGSRVSGRAFVLVLFLLSLRAEAIASAFSNLVVFGDSLSDNGNAAYVFQHFPSFIPPDLPAPAPPLYTAGRYTNGPDVTPATAFQGTWVEQLAGKLGVPDPMPGLPNFVDSTLPPGTNLAVAGSETSAGPANIGSMVTAYVSTQPSGLSSTSLYVLLGGGNDLFRATDPVAAAQAAVANIFQDVGLLQAAGAQHFLVPNLPDLGTTPRAVQSGEGALLSAASLQYDQSWRAALLTARSNGLDVTGVDLYALYQQLEATPAAFGFTNVTTPAQGQSVDPDTYLFWDILHPTTAGHSFIADAAFDALTPTPEPASVLLVTAGIAVLIVRTRRKLTQ